MRIALCFLLLISSFSFTAKAIDLYDGDPDILFVKGTFNDWSLSNRLNKSESAEAWQTTIDIAAGEYYFNVGGGDDEFFYSVVATAINTRESFFESGLLTTIDFNIEYVSPGVSPLAAKNQSTSYVKIPYNSQWLYKTTKNEQGYRLEIYDYSIVAATHCAKQKLVSEKGTYTIKVTPVFSSGESVRDRYTGRQYTVKNGVIEVPDLGQRVVMLEEAGELAGEQNPNNDIAYYVMIDRFYNGNKNNDLSFGRGKDDEMEIGTFHGGDIRGLVDQLPYIKNLGATSIIISSPLQQMNGWVGGGRSGDFKMYGYHGFYTRDYTAIDSNFGTESELIELVKTAHELGLKVYMSAVINHPGYMPLSDLLSDGINATASTEQLTKARASSPDDLIKWKPSPGDNLHSINELIDYENGDWSGWWGHDWVRANVNGYNRPGRTTESESLFFLPDFITESTQKVRPPSFISKPKLPLDIYLGHKPETVSDYLTGWIAHWIATTGFDGVLVDAEKHIDSQTLLKLSATLERVKTKVQSIPAEGNHSKNPKFNIIAENYGHGIHDSASFSRGMTSVLNFQFKDRTEQILSRACHEDYEALYSEYYTNLASLPEKRFYSYLSSHDTGLIGDVVDGNFPKAEDAAMLLAFTPGDIMVFYGDELVRTSGPYGSDKTQGYRSDMPWKRLENSAYKSHLDFWSSILKFRKDHSSISYGQHTHIANQPYTFGRKTSTDRVVVAILPAH